MLSLDRTKEAALDWAKKENFPWPTTMNDDSRKISAMKHVQGVPTYVLLNKEGELLAKGKHAALEYLAENK